MNLFTKRLHFESEDLILIEIKRFLLHEMDKSKLYFWLLFDKSGSTFKRLKFVSMDSDCENEFRVFDNEHLAFDDRKGVLISDGKEYFMDFIHPGKNLNAEVQQSIETFLDSINSQE